MSTRELNIHRLTLNPAIRHKLSYHELMSKSRLDSLRRYQKPRYETIRDFTLAYRENVDPSIDVEKFEVWLGETAE